MLSSKVQDPTGKWLSLDARFLKYQQMTIGWIYDAALRTELTARLGVAWKALDGGQADLACVSETARDLFSSRTAQVEAKLDELIERWSNEHDGEEPDVLTIAKLERAAARTSRPSKQHTVDGAALHGLWVDQTTRAGIDRDDLTAAGLTDASADRSEVDLAALVVEALRRTEEESATWLRADIARHLATLLPPAATRTATETIEMIDRLADVAEQRCLDLAPIHESGPVRRDGRPVAEHVTDRRLTTPAVLAQEQGIQKWARVSAHPTEELTGDLQADAATAMASYADLVVVVGPAGAGKTHTTARAVASLTDQGRPVVGLAPSGKAADVLARETGCRAQTLAAFLARHNGLSRRESLRSGTTILLDEAAMASTQDLANLVALAKQRWWRIVAVGDPAQLPAVGRGGTFAHWCETLPHHRLETPRRFDAPWEADASLGLRAGEPDAAAVYAEHQRLHATHPALLARQIALAHRRQIDRDRTVAITTTTNEMARKINEAIQIRQGHTRNEWKAELADGTRVYAGDQIATRRNNADLTTDMGHQVRNRHTWTVQEVTHKGDLVVTDPDRGTVTLPTYYVDQHVELGWAVTGYGNQGDTVDVGIAVIEPGTGRDHAYVALTRGRQANHAWIPDPTGTLDPADHLGQIIARTPNHESALATQERLHREAGLEPPDPQQLLGEPRGIAIGL